MSNQVTAGPVPVRWSLSLWGLYLSFSTFIACVSVLGLNDQSAMRLSLVALSAGAMGFYSELLGYDSAMSREDEPRVNRSVMVAFGVMVASMLLFLVGSFVAPASVVWPVLAYALVAIAVVSNGRSVLRHGARRGLPTATIWGGALLQGSVPVMLCAWPAVGMGMLGASALFMAASLIGLFRQTR